MIADLQSTFERQKAHSLTLRGEATANRKERIAAIQRWIKANNARLLEAAVSDLRKPRIEFEAVELLHVHNEIRYALRFLEDWTKPKIVDAPIHMLGTRSSVYYEPKGTCLILSPWNYPFALSIGPLISAIAAGNTAMLKPSELTPATSGLIREMAESSCDPRVVSVIEGDASIAQQLLNMPFDHFFFTGSSRVGKIVMKAAAEHLASVTLELGGKSPAIVSEKASIGESARRILVSKFVNAGQTCVAPDYVLVQESVAEAFVARCRELQKQLFVPCQGARIISERNFERLERMLRHVVEQGGQIEFSGSPDRSTLTFPPTMVSRVPLQSELMTEEIFGPILPVVPFKNLEDAIGVVNKMPKPLGLYLFTTSTKERVLVQRKTSSGGMCVNEAAIHFLHPGLPFGGVNGSGMGKAHGHSGFLTFSNEKPVLRQRNGKTLASVLYPPYGKGQEMLLRTLFRFL